MAAAAIHNDFKNIVAGHHWAWLHRHGADITAGPVMHAVNRIGRVAVKQAFFDHFAPAAFVFFGGLKDEIDRAGEIGIFSENFGSPQQHRHMAIMTAGMHFARMFRGIR
jgi:hypothetical protein